LLGRGNLGALCRSYGGSFVLGGSCGVRHCGSLSRLWRTTLIALKPAISKSGFSVAGTVSGVSHALRFLGVRFQRILSDNPASLKR
jgi:hypothetical protein